MNVLVTKIFFFFLASLTNMVLANQCLIGCAHYHTAVGWHVNLTENHVLFKNYSG